jgi:PPK2 family polyphosphate:nucleotide phosphotransferase
MRPHFKVTPPIQLKDFDPDFYNDLNKDETREETLKLCQRIGEFQQMLYANSSHALLILFQGVDTSGKDGAARHLLQCVNPAGVETANFKVPSAEELAHDFLWRIHMRVPRYGNIGVFNRSHYEEVLIVRLLKLQPERVWRKRYAQINAFEKHLVENRIVLLKFFLHISREEQAERLRARIEDKRKNWKFALSDLDMRAKWPQFQRAYEDALNKCSTPWAPWHIVPADRKWYRDFVIARRVLNALEELKLKWPKAKEDLSKVKIV